MITNPPSKILVVLATINDIAIYQKNSIFFNLILYLFHEDYIQPIFFSLLGNKIVGYIFFSGDDDNLQYL